MTAALSSASFRLHSSNAALSLAIALFVGQASAAAGRVDFATDGATVSASNGQQRPLARGSELNSGDTIRTDAGGRAQIRFADGAYVSLQPNTEFSIKDYNFDGKADGSERGFFALAKGTMRTVTGLIGRINKNRYQISTPTATIGIRGTGGRIEVLLDGSTLIAGTSGIWVLSNPSGTLDVPAGTFGRAPAAPNQPPQRSAQGPNTGPAPLPVDPPKPLEPKQAENRTPDGTSDTIVAAAPTPPPANPPLVSGSSFALSAPLDGQCGGDCGAQGFNIITSSAPVDGVFDAAGRLTQFTVTDPQFGATTYILDVANGGMHGTKPGGGEDFGTRDGVIAWGRWIGPVTVTSTFSITNTFAADQGLHYVVGTLTPVSSLPTTRTTLTFSLIGATAPTYAAGGVSPGVLTAASLTANFATGAVGVSLTAMDGNGLGYSGLANGRMNASVPGAIFTTAGSSTGTGCPNGCGITANGFFAGSGATHAGLSYSFTNTSQGSDLIGAAALKR
jgi:hypothetical protein